MHTKKQIVKTLLFAFLLWGSFTNTAAAKEISKFSEDSKKMEFGTIREYTVLPDSQFRDYLTIKNHNDSPYFYELDVQNGISAAGGILTAAYTSDEISSQIIRSFVQLDEKSFRLEAKEEKTIGISVAMSDLPNLNPGDHIGAISITYSPVGTGQQSGSGLSFRTRNVINFIISLPGEKNATFQKGPFLAHKTGNGISSSQTFENTGNRLLKIESENTFKVQEIWNESAGEKSSASLLPPGQKFINIFETQARPRFFQQAQLTQNIKVAAFDSTTGTFITIDDFDNEFSTIFFNNINLGLLAALLVLLTLLVWWVRLRHKLLLSESTLYEVKKDDTLAKIAAEKSLSWQQIAKLNLLKAPYILQEGTKIRLPKQKNLAKTPRNS